MLKTYQPQEIEQRWYQHWEQNDYFAPRDSGNESYCIMIPPPNVTGSLHMGHAFQATLIDTMIRYQRMLGKQVLWQVGTDHAGIATQMVVERRLQQQGRSRHDLGREPFIEQVWQWKQESGDTITRQLRRIGASVDWSTERFTMDAGFSRAVQEVFIRLYNEGLIYRGKRLVNWDPVLHTAISDLEVINQEEDGFMYHVNYPLVDDPEHFVTIATTRPETMLADTAIAVHPEDARYQQLIGKKVKVPCTDRAIAIIADAYVDPEFGTGCLKVTPAHDFNDDAVGQRHQLEIINILTPDARLNENAPAQYQGLDCPAAREKIVEDLKVQNLLVKIEPHQLKRPRGDRSGAVIEPYLTDQWFVKVEDLGAEAQALVQDKKIRFMPENWVNTYNAWMNNLQDWCISRQLWWGHRIPAWYMPDGKIYVGASEAEVRAQHKLPADLVLEQDQDVLDTWFSSALWTFGTLGWPEPTERLKTFHPTNVLVTGFDIIFFWVARMMMMTLKFTGQIPFKEVYIHGLVRDAEGQKMSKSKGNVLDPIDLIDGISLDDLVAKRTANLMQPEKAQAIAKATRKQFSGGIDAYGTDALRFTFCSLASTGRDIKFDMGRIAGYRNFCNKLWNAARFVLLQVAGDADYVMQLPDYHCLDATEKWMISRLQQTIQHLTEALEHYRFDLASQILYDFIWHDFCDWYLEFSKVQLQKSGQTAQVRDVLLYVLDQSLRLAHPFIPFITEEIWQQLRTIRGFSAQHTQHGTETIMLADYPRYDPTKCHTNSMDDITWLQNIITAVRNIRGEMNVSPARKLSLYWISDQVTDQQRLTTFAGFIQQLARCKAIVPQADGHTEPCATHMMDQLELRIPLAELVDDPTAELVRLQKKLDKISQDVAYLEGKLCNPAFIHKAPDAIVAKEQLKLKESKTMQRNVQEKIAQLKH